MTAENRLADELRYVGGEKMLNELSPADRALWNRQSLVLSYLREHGNVSEAAVKAKVPVAIVHEWYTTNELGYTLRHDQARADVGRRVLRAVTEQVMDGKNKNPTTLKLVLGDLLPDQFGDTSTVDEDNPIDQLRKMNEEAEKRQEQADAISEAERLTQSNDDGGFNIV